jgi:hypothetical protein
MKRKFTKKSFSLQVVQDQNENITQLILSTAGKEYKNVEWCCKINLMEVIPLYFQWSTNNQLDHRLTHTYFFTISKLHVSVFRDHSQDLI